MTQAARWRRLASAGGHISRAHVVQLALFALNGVATALIYSVAVWSFIAMSPATFTLDVVVAYAIATAANYVGARLLFGATNNLRAHLVRYLTVVAGNFAVAALVASLLHRLGANDALSAYLPVALTAIPTFVLMRTWVFKNPDQNGLDEVSPKRP